MLLLTTLLSACGPAEPAAPAADEAAPGSSVSVADIAGNLTNYTGRTVTVRGEIEESIHPNVFSVDEDALAEGGIDNDVVVVNAGPNAAEVTEENEGEEVIVTGEVRQFVLSEIEEEFNLGLDPEIEAEFDQRAVIIATAVEVVE
jgi:hypothetical protein